MLWVIFGHVYLVEVITGVSNMIDYFQVCWSVIQSENCVKLIHICSGERAFQP